MPNEKITEVTYLPNGVPWDDVNAKHYMVTVKYHGEPMSNGAGGYGIHHQGDSLSRAGNWGYPEKFQFRQYRWDNLEDALKVAAVAVQDVKVSGKTWHEWQAWFDRKTEVPVE